MPDLEAFGPGQLTAAAERLRQRKPSQQDRYYVAGLLDKCAERLDPPTPKRAKPSTIEEAVQQLDEPIKDIEE